MDTTNHLYEASQSFRANSSSVWRDTGMEVFSRPSMTSNHEDEEEDLKWAALERLPTFNRLKKGLLTSSSGEASEVDVRKLGFQERNNLIQRLVKDTETQNEKFLMRLRERLDRAGVEIPALEVRYEHVKVDAEAHVGTRALPSFFNFYINFFEGILSSLHLLKSRKKHVSILRDLSGIIRPSRITLLLGPPSSGRTSLLLALAGKLSPDVEFSGKVTYNGLDMNESAPWRASAYISQHDIHNPEMTVRETLSFSSRCQGVGHRHEWLAELSRREKAANIQPDPDIDVFMKASALQGQKANVFTDYVLKILGLDICAETMVGDGMLRGISGGQKKRVTTGEMLVGPAKVLFMDEISTGLDSSTTYQIVNSLRQSMHILNGTAVIALLQPPPETYNLFDDIILLSDGQIVYQGPREHVLEFFESLGFKCPERKGVADFLQEVTSEKDQEQYWAHRDKAYKFVTVKEFTDTFQSFHVGKKIKEDLSVPFDKSEKGAELLAPQKYGVGKKELLKACMSREYLLMKRNSFVYVFKFVQLIVMAFITMTLFIRTRMHRDSITDGGIFTGALFFCMIMVMFNGMSELSLTIAKLSVFYKQRDLMFFPAWAYALPGWLIKVPLSFVEVAIWVFMTYYVIGFDPNVHRLFRQYFIFILVHQMASGLFRLIAALGRNMVIATTGGSFALLVLFVNGGFVLSRVDIKKWWIWAYWISPMMYAQNAVEVNEFLGNSWKHVLPNTEQPLGILVLKSRGFFTEQRWYWIGVGGLIGFIILFNLAYVLALTYLDSYDKAQSSQLDESQENEQAQKTANEGNKASAEINSSKKKGMTLPFQQQSLTFNDVVYSVDMPPEMKNQGVSEDKLVLLKGVSGAFRPGVLTALMGVSGAGKTTLMDVLAGRKTGGYIDGDIKISGYPKKQETFARISGYCEQNDIHSPHVTVYESLLFSAWLRLPSEVNSTTRKMFVEEVMELVELKPLRKALVGLPGVNGLSTEQRKRLTIAVELVANPSIIFMDEPTSGLDARAAAIVMRTVRNTVDTGRTVVCTIHQPSIDIFESFDELLLMKRGGEEIYVGPLGHHSCDLIKYFEDIEGVSKIKGDYNPATWMLEVSSYAQEQALGVDFSKVYKNSELYRRNKELIRQLSTPPPDCRDLHFPSQYSQSFYAQCIACFWKQRLSYWRNPPYTAVRFLFTAIIAIMFGTMFWDLGSKTKKQQDLFNAMGCMYCAVQFIGIQNAGSVQPVVSVERTVFYREKAAGMYSPLAYAFAQIIIELPYIFIQTLVYAVIVYSMMGHQWTAAKFFWYLFFMYFTLLYFTFYGMMAVAVTPNFHIATIISSAFYGVWNLFSGFIVPRTRMPVWWRWYYYICPVSWTLYGLVISQYGDMDDMLDNGVTVKQFLKSYFGFEHKFLGPVAGIVTAFVILFGLIFAVSIKVFNFQKR
ncbi:hypothetical protein ACFX1Z_024934 [Malus domestica]